MTHPAPPPASGVPDAPGSLGEPSASGPRSPSARPGPSGARPRRTTASTVAIVLAGLVLTLPLAVGRLLELVLKALNPADVDVSAGLAHLRPLLVTGVMLVIAAFVAAVVAAGVATRRDGRRAARPAWILLAAQAVLVVVILVATVGVDAVTVG